MSNKTKVEQPEVLSYDRLQEAYDGSFYTICGAGGDLNEWVTGLGDVMEEEGIGRPTKWYQTLGGDINRFAQKRSGWSDLRSRDAFPSDLTILMFSLDGLDIGKLAIFRIKAEDRWFDDIIQNMQGM